MSCCCDLSPIASLSGSDVVHQRARGQEHWQVGWTGGSPAVPLAACIVGENPGLAEERLGITHAPDAALVTSRPSDCGLSQVAGKTRSLEVWVIALLIRS